MDWKKLGEQLAKATKTTGKSIVTSTVWVGRQTKNVALTVSDAAGEVGKAYKEEWDKQKKGDE
jgi:hypothetical protein